MTCLWCETRFDRLGMDAEEVVKDMESVHRRLVKVTGLLEKHGMSWSTEGGTLHVIHPAVPLYDKKGQRCSIAPVVSVTLGE